MQNIMIIGGNRGIGLELCRQYVARGDRVLSTSRNSSPELGDLAVEVIEGVDVCNDEDVLRLKEFVNGTTINTLVHNSGILSRESLGDLDFGRIQRQFEVNTLGPLRVVHALLDNLRPGSKIGIVTSRMGSVYDNSSGGMYGYRISKAGANMVGRSLAQDLKEQHIPVALLHPGMVATEMTDSKGIEPQAAARGLIQRMDKLNMGSTGTFWHAEGYELPW